MLDKDKKIVILTGSGISAESGLSTFRDKNGIWDRYDPDRVCSLSGFLQDPTTAWLFNSELYLQYSLAKPNLGHKSLVKLEHYLNKNNLTVITQNVDGLHQSAGSDSVIEIHGTIHKTRCNKCKYTTNTRDVVCKFMLDKEVPTCPECGGLLRPDVVMFEETPKYKQLVDQVIINCDYFIQIGTSGKVMPASTLIHMAELCGAKSIVINKDEPDNITKHSTYYYCSSGVELDNVISEIIETY